MSVSPGHRGALDVYVPLVDWGARFEAIKAPIRLRVDLQTVDRKTATEPRRGQAARRRAGARGGDRGAHELPDAAVRPHGRRGARARPARRLRHPQPRPAPALDGGARDRSRRSGSRVAMVVLIPPRGEIANPQYYAHGPDIPRALEAVEAARRTSGVLDQELDAQLVGLARLVIEPGPAPEPRRPAGDHGRLRPAQQPVRDRRAAADRRRRPGVLRRRPDRPRLAAGDARSSRQAAHSASRSCSSRGNHDSDYLARELASDGAIVLTRTGRLKPDGSRGPIINTIAGLRVAGYDDPFERRSAESFKDRYDNTPDPAMQDEFLHWLTPLIGKVDVVMVHEPALIRPRWRSSRTTRPTARSSSSSATPTRPTSSTQPGRDGDQRRQHRRGRDRQPDRDHDDEHRALRLHAEAVVPAAGGRSRVDRPRHRLLVRPPDHPRTSVGSARWRRAARAGPPTGLAPLRTDAGDEHAAARGVRAGRAAHARRRARAGRRDGVLVVRDPRLPPPGARRGRHRPAGSRWPT